MHLGGRERRVRMSNKAIATVEELLGRPWHRIEFANMGVRELAAMTYAAAMVCDPKVTLDTVYEWMDEEGQAPSIKAVQLAIEALSGGPDTKKEPPGP